MAEAEAAEAAAARLLAARARTREDLRRRLAPRFPPAALERALDRLQAIGAIDDAAFARRWLEVHAATMGGRALRAGLRREGIPAPQARRLVAEQDFAAEGDRAAEVVRSVAGRYRNLPRDKAAQRLWALLARRGFEPDAARRAVREALAIDPADDGAGG